MISAAWSPMSLWIELRREFEKAYRAEDSDRVARIMKYARWCWTADSDDTVAAVLCAFFEHLPEDEAIRRDIPRWFSRSEFERLREVFTYHAGSASVAQIEREYAGRK